MSIQKLTDTLYIAPQLTQSDIEQAAALGIQTVICNRPDGEDPAQPEFAQIRQSLAAHNITALHQPIASPNHIQAADIDTFAAALQTVPAPILAYCRSGTRSALLWGLAQIRNGGNPATVLAAAQAARIDLSRFVPMLEDAAK
ncbi:TIGR01244 family sulfur transferase [Neisseria sp. ZJ106]|uniref:TIGR01244 family sulfur transferase n=1 Tax=Neisseria lisongii TaxID=2912188 RepID=A0ABY7RL53_9NEIS|nr:TIGR01244 family sulfur transferase [Neisseria lisongii]MCF7521763.1 TIGR01244 family sulfur transferase [Neisseria lisongii]WCL71000.1 TIGR01244 family sulfur transferase [Neisseria lisongii]